MSVKKQTDWPKEKLKKWAKPALEYPELVGIACTAQSNTEAKDKALEFTKEQGLEEKVAMACRWLRILRAKIGEEEFKTYLANDCPKKEKEEMEKKDIRIVEFQLPENTKIIQRAGDKFNNVFISFSREQKAIKFCNDLLEAITGVSLPSREEDMEKLYEHDAEEEGILLKLLIKILEERFGLVVTVCGNCKYYRGGPGLVCGDGLCWVEVDKLRSTKWNDLAESTRGFPPHGYGEAAKERPASVNCYSRCIKDWAPKEVSEKPKIEVYKLKWKKPTNFVKE